MGVPPYHSKENEDIRESCTLDVPVTGKPNMYRPKLKSSLYIQKMIVASIVTPDMYNAELQDSYGVKTPEDLLMAMVMIRVNTTILPHLCRNFRASMCPLTIR